MSDEYSYITQYLSDTTATRNNLLTFSFTAVLTVIGIAFANFEKDLPAALYLVPFGLILPFTARITYYRISGAHYSSFLQVFYPEKFTFAYGRNFVKEEQVKQFKIIALLINFEMLILSAVCVILFLTFQINKEVPFSSTIDILLFIMALLLFALDWFIIIIGYNYRKINNIYLNKWKLAKCFFGENFINYPQIGEVLIPFLEAYKSYNMPTSCTAAEMGYTDEQFELILSVLQDYKLICYSKLQNTDYIINVKPKLKNADFNYIQKFFQNR